jgi:transcriptional regulator with XRE-family HTH domain
MLKIKLLRMSFNLSQWELSHKAGLSQGRYSMIERGLVEPTDEERAGIATVLGANPLTLFRSAVRTRPPDDSSASVAPSEAIA